MQRPVCLLNDSFPPLIDGVANAVVNYARVLTDDGPGAMVVTPHHPDARDEAFPYPVIRYPSIDMRETVGYLAGIPFSAEAAAAVEQARVSVLHSHCPIVSTILARQLRSVVRAPLILTYHTKFDVELSNLFRSRLLQAGGQRALVRNISACDEVWVVSQGAGENLRALGYEGDYVVMPNGVDLPRGAAKPEQIQAAVQNYDLPAQLPVFLFVGRMQWYKGQRVILDALSRLHRDGKAFRMVFIGVGADLEDIRNYAAQVGLERQCIFTGAVQSRETLRCWYSRADLFLFPSTFDTNGLVVREAAACGTASVLIAGSCAAEGIVHGQNGFLMEESAESLHALLQTLSVDVMRQVGQAAQQEIYLSWDEAVHRAMHRYEVVLDRFHSGLYASHTQPMERLLHVNGELMEDLGHLLTVRHTLRQRLKNRREQE